MSVRLGIREWGEAPQLLIDDHDQKVHINREKLVATVIVNMIVVCVGGHLQYAFGDLQYIR